MRIPSFFKPHKPKSFDFQMRYAHSAESSRPRQKDQTLHFERRAKEKALSRKVFTFVFFILTALFLGAFLYLRSLL